jgi:hypothetical protein
LIPPNEKFVNFYKNEMKYLEHLRFEFFALKNWSNEKFTKVTGEWNKFNRRIFTRWQKYKEISKLVFFLNAINSTGNIKKPTDEWAKPGLVAIDYYRKKIANLRSMCLRYQSLLNGSIFDADIQFIHDMRLRLAQDLSVLEPSATSDKGWDDYKKKSDKLRKKIAEKEEQLRIRSIYSENRYVSEYQDVYFIPEGSSEWDKFRIINFGEPVGRVRVRDKRAINTIFEATAMFLLLMASFGLLSANQPSDKAIEQEIIALQEELAKLVYTGSKKPAFFIYKYIGEWAYFLSNLEDAMVKTNKSMTKLVEIYPEKLSEIDAALVSIKKILQTKGKLSSSQVKTLQALIKTLDGKWDFDLVLPALDIQGGDRIGCIKVEEPQWLTVEMGVDGLVPG